MRLRFLLVPALLALALVGGLCTTVPVATAAPSPTDGVVASAPPNPALAGDVGRRAYDYGFPLMEFLRVRREMTSVRCPDTLGNAPVNAFSHRPLPTDASDRTVVAPNTDTLYSIAHLDLRRGPLVLSWPNMGKRYFSFAMLDPFTDNIAIPGSREDGPKAGSVLVRWRQSKGKARPRDYDRVVTSKYRRVWVIGRTLASSTRDQRRAYRKMTQYTLTRPSGRARTFRDGCRPGKPASYPTPSDGETFVRRLNRALVTNPPPFRDRAILAELAPYGIGPGLDPDDAALDPATREALYAGIAGEAAYLPQSIKLRAVQGALTHDGWFDPPEGLGDYQKDYTLRAQIASAGLGANKRVEAIYPTGVLDSTGLPYVGTNTYRLVLPADDMPPARYFWSLTMYDSDGYLVPTPTGRYAVGPTHPPYVTRPDGSAVVIMSPTRPDDRTVNWLPTPSGQFRLNLRLYGPSRAALKGTWSPPAVQNLGPLPVGPLAP
ncbi:MAG: hypothetical protein CMH83_12970 [Nocardioides sp.]|nr:hypothetical protein [Nocardioides sp.]